MLRRLELEEVVGLKRMSDYELGVREPTLDTILHYARVAGVHMEDIVDDELELPAKLPGNVRYKGIPAKSAPRSKKR
jgi:transcriptional regulator with XRE-family HTH domain